MMREQIGGAMQDKCSVCGLELQPGSFPQLQFSGTWVCQTCIDAAKMGLMIVVVKQDDRG